jgi:tetrahydromethanopterin S-methyltransferase subunit G
MQKFIGSGAMNKIFKWIGILLGSLIGLLLALAVIEIVPGF